MALTFKSYLKRDSVYSGGKSRPEIAGKTIHKLSSNENQLGASPKALAAVKNHFDRIWEYPDSDDFRLRAALSEFYKGTMSPDQFLSFNGGVAGIELIIKGFVEAGAECVFSFPGFSPYKDFPRNEGGIGIDVPLIGDDFQLDVKGILDAINERTRLVFIGAPNNPTGSCPTRLQIDELLEGLPSHVILVYDEVYYQYVDQSDFVRAFEYVQKGYNVIGLNSFSKAYGLAGLRVGYAYTTKEIAQYLQGLRRAFLVDSLSTEAAIAALEDVEFINRSVAMVHQEKQFLYQELERLGYRYWLTQANFILIEPNEVSNIFEAKMLEEGIMVRPVTGFGHHGIRITIGTHEQNLDLVAALEKLKRA